jgi:hypothetical protein
VDVRPVGWQPPRSAPGRDGRRCHRTRRGRPQRAASYVLCFRRAEPGRHRDAASARPSSPRPVAVGVVHPTAGPVRTRSPGARDAAVAEEVTLLPRGSSHALSSPVPGSEGPTLTIDARLVWSTSVQVVPRWSRRERARADDPPSDGGSFPRNYRPTERRVRRCSFSLRDRYQSVDRSRHDNLRGVIGIRDAGVGCGFRRADPFGTGIVFCL